MVHFLLSVSCLLLTFFVAVVVCADVSIDINITREVISNVVPPGFTSFSCSDTILNILSQTTQSGGFIPRPSFISLMSLLGGGANIRLGHWWAHNSGSHNNFTYPEANATSIARVADALKLFNGTASPMVAPVDLVDGDLVAATGAAFLRYLPQSQFAGIELANEPDISTFKGDYSRYTDEYVGDST